jgi:hypothetical protein
MNYSLILFCKQFTRSDLFDRPLVLAMANGQPFQQSGLLLSRRFLFFLHPTSGSLAASEQRLTLFSRMFKAWAALAFFVPEKRRLFPEGRECLRVKIIFKDYR